MRFGFCSGCSYELTKIINAKLKRISTRCEIANYDADWIFIEDVTAHHRFDQNIVRISALKFFVASWGLPGSFLGLPGDLVSNIINKEAYRKPPKACRKPLGSYTNFQGRNPYNIFVAFLVETITPKRHFEIN